MKLEQKHVLNKPADNVIQMYTDRAFFERKYQMLGFTNIQVLEHEKTGDTFRIKVSYTTQTNAPIPEIAKKFVPSEAQITQTDSWDIRTRKGQLQVDIKGTPVKAVCDMALTDSGSGAVNTHHWNISCGIPLVGGKIEKIVAQDIEAKSGNDVRVTNEILQDY
ncbi:DUF2505 domain-containing protein [Sinimarinibacterium sp. NLF-5-8]|uniref:DUF2505 domain-containing protein n=1 Tax=Sinimarinibacterium sp. NLF-5-8 TaxID=2698684 RepID=UPI00137C202B|nr:DUF2505 domain-containing protein [Sinimarinibacterium sp. NLF-5-8]QHS09573.1 DUF2505 domain-containing protein [Sinimarinibacterium sp. NLF-5-8]